MANLHLTLPAAVTAQMPWEEFCAALEREQGLGFRRRVEQGHMFGAQSENCLAVPLFTCFLFQGWLAGPPVLLSSREPGKISCLLISLFVEGFHLCGDFVFPPTRHRVPVLRGAVALPQQPRRLRRRLVLFPSSHLASTLAGGPGLRKQTQSCFLSISLQNLPAS